MVIIYLFLFFFQQKEHFFPFLYDFTHDVTPFVCVSFVLLSIWMLDCMQVDCLGGREFEIAINKKSTCGDVVKEIRTMLVSGSGSGSARN